MQELIFIVVVYSLEVAFRMEANFISLEKKNNNILKILKYSSFVKSDGVFPFSDAASLLTRGTENVRDTFGPLTMFIAIFHSGGSLVYIHRARTLLCA